MKLINRCYNCSKIMFFFSKQEKEKSQTYCPICHKELLIKKQELRKERIKLTKEKKKKQRILNKKKADQKLREELKSQKNKLIQEEQIPEEDTKPQTPIEKPKPTKEKSPSPRKTTTVTRQDIEKYDSILYIKADVKQLEVIEWYNQKKRTALNKTREIRRTHAGGFSAEKFQKFVDHKKKTTSDWILELLNRPGVLKQEYDKIFYEIEDKKLKEEIENFLNEYLD